MKIKHLLFLLLVFIFSLSSLSQDLLAKTYPQIRLGGYKKWYYGKFDVSPAKNYELALQDSTVQAWTTDGPWMENLNLFISADVNDQWQVRYGLWQLGGMPDSYNFGLQTGDLLLSYGDQRQLLADQELLFHDRINGVGGQYKLGAYRLTVISGNYPAGNNIYQLGGYSGWKEFMGGQYGRSMASSYFLNNSEFEFLGLELGRIDIIKESVQVALDDEELVYGVEYFVDTELGLILIPDTFNYAKKVKVAYKLSNSENREKMFDLKKDAKRRAFLSPGNRIIDDSEVITVDGQKKDRDIDYKANYNLGLFIMKEPVPDDADVRINYEYTYGASLYASETITGQTGTVVDLAHDLLISNSEVLIKNGQELTRGIDYLITYTSGTVNFTQSLVATDTLEATYSYLGAEKSVGLINVEYDVTSNSKVGASAVALTSAIDYASTKNDSPIIDARTINLYGQTVIGQDTFMRAEIASSSLKENVSLFRLPSEQADNAFILSGRTRLSDIEWDGTYRRTGFSFPSIRKVKSNIGRMYEGVDINMKLPFILIHNSTLKAGIKHSVEKFNVAPSMETESTAASIGFNYMNSKYWDIEIVDRIQQQEYNDMTTMCVRASQSSLISRCHFDVDECIGIVRFFSDETDLVWKNLYESQNGLLEQGVYTDINERKYQMDIGWLMKYKWGISSYILLTQEEFENLNSVSDKYNRTTPLFRLSYVWGIGKGNDLEISVDYAKAQQKGLIDYDKVTNNVNLAWKWLLDNPIISEFRLNSTVTSSDYVDLNDASNNYKSNTIQFAGGLIF